MEGTIKIIADKHSLSFDMAIGQVSKMDKLKLFDALSNVLSLDDEERTVIGLTIVAGGMKAVAGIEPTMVTFDEKMMKKVREKRADTEDLTSEKK